MKISKKQVRNLVSVLLCDLSFSAYAVDKSYDKARASDGDSIFLNTIFANVLEGGVRKVAILQELLEKAPYITLDDEGAETLAFWLDAKKEYNRQGLGDEQRGDTSSSQEQASQEVDVWS